MGYRDMGRLELGGGVSIDHPGCTGFGKVLALILSRIRSHAEY